jgi:predicted porin
MNLGGSYRYSKGLNGEADKLALLGASYIIGDFRFHIGWGTSDSKASGFLKARAHDAGVQRAPVAQLTTDFDYIAKDRVGTDNDAHFWRVQAAYYLSKRTSFIANVVALKNNGRLVNISMAWVRRD